MTFSSSLSMQTTQTDDPAEACIITTDRVASRRQLLIILHTWPHGPKMKKEDLELGSGKQYILFISRHSHSGQRFDLHPGIAINDWSALLEVVHPGETQSPYFDWHLEYLKVQPGLISSTILQPILSSNTALKSGPCEPITLFLRSLRCVADLLSQKRSVQLVQIRDVLGEKELTATSNDDRAYTSQSEFIAFSLLTMLCSAKMDPTSNMLQIEVDWNCSELDTYSTDEIAVDSNVMQQPLKYLLRQFGGNQGPIPCTKMLGSRS